jgi:hypothetical protein
VESTSKKRGNNYLHKKDVETTTISKNKENTRRKNPAPRAQARRAGGHAKRGKDKKPRP